MKEVEWNEFMKNYDKYIGDLKRTGEVWVLVHQGKKELVVMHEETYKKMHQTKVLQE